MGDITIREELKEAFRRNHIEYIPLKEASAEEFYQAIGQAKQSNAHSAFVTQHSIADYS